MNVGDLVFRVSRSLGLDDSTSTDELRLMQNWANDSVIDVLLKTHVNETWIGIATVAGTSEYNQAPSSFLYIDNIKGPTARGPEGPYDLISIQEMIEFKETGTAYSDPPKIAIEGSYVTIYPALTGTVQFLTCVRPTALVSSANLGTTTDNSHAPDNSIYGGIPQEYHRALEYYMLWRGAEYDDKSAATYGKGAAQGYLDRYNDEIKLMKKARKARTNRMLIGAKTPGYPASRPGSGRRDVYPER